MELEPHGELLRSLKDAASPTGDAKQKSSLECAASRNGALPNSTHFIAGGSAEYNQDRCKNPANRLGPRPIVSIQTRPAIVSTAQSKGPTKNSGKSINAAYQPQLKTPKALSIQHQQA
jgi:hypothetical protein